MGKKSQLDRALEDMQQQLDALTVRFNAEASGLHAAMLALRAQQRKPRAVKPRAVEEKSA